ncbi:hypothetical protein K458DRAFT_410183 [Lentithecium fluviatile CBS 122367]|uniref:Up-regulated in Daf-2 domain-containing protein n=1 Tax=Lentithecium fluviatile CBS 122367 TaxID=1168545 RepID=A0A6G1IEZ7_9PLEO|nr:hypothetical protein K458DRAFT_410183 [Lentithecium fluviatile CBS 122367]
MRSLFSPLFLVLYLLPVALAEYNKAQVKIQNNTPDTLSGVGVAHKYSDNYKNDYTWEESIVPGATSTETMTVEYNTGWLTTGRDWWMVTYHRNVPSAERSGELKMWYTAPKNLRNVIDILEQMAPKLIKAAIDKLKKPGDPRKMAAGVAAGVVSKVMCKLMFNDESTDGFKQHILREADEDRVTTIVINADNTVTFKSKSGNSNTGTDTRWVAVEYA